MIARMQPPSHIRNVPLWEEHCRMLRARALDFIEGRLSVLETARAIAKLAYWTGTGNDPDVSTFVGIDSETDILPVGEARRYWAPHALEREDAEIARAEQLYRLSAIDAAGRLVKRFEWALDARASRRRDGHAV